MLAIIIPFFKLNFFRITLNSLANQSNKQFKVYVGDDASPVNPLDLLKEFEGKFDFIYHRFETNLGSVSLVKHWDRCISMTDGEKWLMILGDDDYLGENVVEEFYKNFHKFNTNTNVLRYASKIVNQDSNSISEIFTHPIQEKATDSFFRKFKFLTRSSLSEYIFKRECYDKFKFNDFPLAWYADDLAWLEFSCNKPIFSINNAVVYFRMSNENISGKEDNLKDKDYSKFLFYKQLINNQLNHFNSSQKEVLLLEFGVIAKNQNHLEKNFLNIALRLVKNGSFYYLAKFIRRFYKSQLQK